MMEHRCGMRTPVDIPVRLRFGDGVCGVGRILNLSWGGMFIRTSARPRRNRCIDVRLVLPAAKGDRVLLVPGMVVHAAGGGLGLMFRNLDVRTSEALAQYIWPTISRPIHRDRRTDVAA
jgi:hypothetical protein